MIHHLFTITKNLKPESLIKCPPALDYHTINIKLGPNFYIPKPTIIRYRLRYNQPFEKKKFRYTPVLTTCETWNCGILCSFNINCAVSMRIKQRQVYGCKKFSKIQPPLLQPQLTPRQRAQFLLQSIISLNAAR